MSLSLLGQLIRRKQNLLCDRHIFYPEGPHRGRCFRKVINFKGFPQRAHLNFFFLYSRISGNRSVMTSWINEMSSRTFSNRERAVGIEKAIVSYLHKPFWQDMLKKSSDKFHGVKRQGFPSFFLTIFIKKFNETVFNAFNAVIGDGDTEYIP